MCFELEVSNVVHSASVNTQWLLVCLQVWYSVHVHVHVDGSITLYGLLSNFKHGCMTVACRHLPGEGGGGGGGGGGFLASRSLRTSLPGIWSPD